MTFGNPIAPDSPDTRALPGRTAATIGLATIVTASAAQLMKRYDARLMSVTVAVNGAKPALTLPWDSRFAPRFDLARDMRRDPACRTVLRELNAAAAAIARDLRPRWPVYAMPARIGMISDGHGLAFSPDDPCPAAPDWLARQICGAKTLIELAPCGATGALRLLARARPAWPLH